MTQQTTNYPGGGQGGNLPPFPQYSQPAKRRRWWIPFLIIGALFVVFILPALIIFGLVISSFEGERVEVKDNTILVVNLGMELSEYTSTENPFAELFGGKQTSFRDVIQAIKTAKDDDRIRGIYFNSSLTSMGFAKNLELINALKEFKSSGKFLYSFIEMGTESQYMTTLPSDKIFMPQEGFVSLNGFGIEAMFFKGLLEKLGIEYYVEQFEDFKSAGEMTSRTKFSDSAKKAYRAILNQRHKLFVNEVSKARNLQNDFINEVLERGVYSADSLLALGFVDSLTSENDFKEFLKSMINPQEEEKSDGKNEKKDRKSKKENNQKLRTISVSNYLNADYEYDESLVVKGKQIAVIYCSGPIVDAPSGQFSGAEQQITSKFAQYIKEARENDKIKAIILRVDSPGGSVMASDAIWSEVVKTRGVKPIYSSMSDVAASGGYYISMACDTIIAHPATITGSIGVIAMLPNISGTLGKLGITLDTLSTTKSAQDLSFNFPFNQRQKEKLHTLVEKTYNRFVTKVAEGRKMSFDEARALAKGRVWTGEDAKAKGLVDVLGGMDEAIKIAKARIGVEERQKVRIIEYPKQKDPIEAIIEMFRGGDDEAGIADIFEKAFGNNRSSYAEIYKALPPMMRMQLDYAKTLFAISQNEPFIMAMPYTFEIK